MQRFFGQLRAGETLEEMDSDVFGTFAFGRPKHGSLEPIDTLCGHPMNAEFEIQRVSWFHSRLQSEQAQAYSGLGPTRTALAGGCTTTGKLRQNDGHRVLSPS